MRVVNTTGNGTRHRRPGPLEIDAAERLRSGRGQRNTADPAWGSGSSTDQGGGNRRSDFGGLLDPGQAPYRQEFYRQHDRFICPLSRSDGTPPRWVAKLYLPPGAKHFGSREGHVDRLAARKFRKNVMEVTF
jgi:hypothetical protein